MRFGFPYKLEASAAHKQTNGTFFRGQLEAQIRNQQPEMWTDVMWWVYLVIHVLAWDSMDHSPWREKMVDLMKLTYHPPHPSSYRSMITLKKKKFIPTRPHSATGNVPRTATICVPGNTAKNNYKFHLIQSWYCLPMQNNMNVLFSLNSFSFLGSRGTRWSPCLKT